MGFLDKAKKLADQAQAKADELQKQFNEKQAGSGPEPHREAVEYDQFGRPIRSGGGTEAAPPPSPVGDAPLSGAPAGPVGAPPAPAPAPVAVPSPSRDRVEDALSVPTPLAAPPPPPPPASGPPQPDDAAKERYEPPPMTSGDPLAS